MMKSVQEKIVEFFSRVPNSRDSGFLLSGGGGGTGKAIKFPMKLMYTLECGDYDHLVEWAFNGRSFVVKNTDEFSVTVLPALFKEAKFDSFARKMRRWGFSTKRRPTGSGWLFQHPLFQRGNYSLSSQMSCTNRRFNMSPQEDVLIRLMDPSQQLVSSQSPSLLFSCCH
jgi:hypothetical protein